MEDPRTPQAAFARTFFNGRAPTYDASNGGWHATLAAEYVSWLSSFLELRGAKILDLACGTGLVTFPLARAVGPTGRVVGADISKEMLEVAREKMATNAAVEAGDLAPVELVEGDFTDLSNIDSIMDVVRNHGGWDAITVCSAVPFIADVGAAFRHWASMLRPGGVLIFDVPTEDRTVQSLLTIDVPERLGRSLLLDRRWVQGLGSLEEVCRSGGLKMQRAWRTQSWLPEKVWRPEQADEVWEKNLRRDGSGYKNAIGEDLGDEKGREVWRECIRENLRSDGTFVDGHWLYIVVAKKE
ncbi:MAG: hypothetical protein Q9160_007689 [Pyrenula sp. 1 TL-2023]